MNLAELDEAALPCDLPGLWRLAVRWRMLRPAALGPVADRLAVLAGDDPALQVRARVVLAWSQGAQGQRDAALANAQVARALLGDRDDVALLDLVDDVDAWLAHTGGQYALAIARGEAVAARAEASTDPTLLSTTLSRLAGTYERSNQADAALRWHYRGLAVAAQADDPLVQGRALCFAGGFQLSLLNVTDAATLCEQAWQLLQGYPGSDAWGSAAVNWMMVQVLQRRLADAMPLAEQVLAAEHLLSAPGRYQRKMLLASVLARAGDARRAQAVLDEAVAVYPMQAALPVEWTCTQAHLHNLAGHHDQALALCQAHQARLAAGQTLNIDGPADQAFLYGHMATALEALGRPAEALQAVREAAAAEREQFEAANRAHRMTLQIQFELETVRRDRDTALQREQAAAQEQARLAELNHQLELANLAKTRFLAAASHDLRQPLHALGLQLAHLDAGLQQADQQAVAQRMARTLGALTAMFDTLLDISRMDAGVVSPRLQPVALAPLLTRLADELAPVAAAQGLRLALHLPGTRANSWHTRSDPALLETLLRNLLSNALRYTARGGVLLALRHRAGGFSLQVWDTGVGIAPADQARVFDEFYQVGNAQRDREQGLGLGLAIVRRLAGLLDHGLALRSQPGRGSCFALQVPMVAAPPPLVVAPAAPAGAGRPLRIAVIEDDADVRDSLLALLRRWGHQVAAGSHADEVLHAQPAGWEPDAVVADYRLPDGRTGDAEVARLVQRIGRPVAALIVTGDTAPGQLRTLAASGLPWLSKPLQPARLRAWLATCPSSLVLG